MRACSHEQRSTSTFLLDSVVLSVGDKTIEKGEFRACSYEQHSTSTFLIRQTSIYQARGAAQSPALGEGLSRWHDCTLTY